VARVFGAGLDMGSLAGPDRNGRFAGLDTASEPAFYMPYRQAPHHGMSLLVALGVCLAYRSDLDVARRMIDKLFGISTVSSPEFEASRRAAATSMAGGTSPGRHRISPVGKTSSKLSTKPSRASAVPSSDRRRSAVDRGTLGLLDRHRRLLLEQTPRDDPERRRIEKELRHRLGTFAETSVDRMVQGIAAELMDDDFEDLSPEKRQEVRGEILERARARKETLQSVEG
jgi:hypothetical protein